MSPRSFRKSASRTDRDPHADSRRQSSCDGTAHRVQKPRNAPGSRPRSPSKAPSPTGWGDVAEWYDRHVGDDGNEFHREIVLPGVSRLLDLRPGQPILDVACGQGVLCRYLHERGARVVGIDAAPELIRAARDRGPADIPYFVTDARAPGALQGAPFDSAACVLAIQNIHPVQPVFEMVARALTDRGRFVLVMTHPCFRGAKESSWGWDTATGVQYRRVDRYLTPRKTPIVTHPGSDPGTYTWSFHKPIESYVKALRQAGLWIDAMEEWPSHKHSDSGPRAAAENTARKEIPMFLAIRARKIDEGVAPATAPSHDPPS